MHKFWSSFFKYNPREYWLKRGEVFFDEKLYDKQEYRSQEKTLLQYLLRLNFSSVFEFGCGFERITRLLLDNFDVKEYLATEYSPDLLEHAKNLTSKFKNIQFKRGLIQDIKIEKKYDLVLGVEVLMHVKPIDIKYVIQKLVSMSNEHVVNVDFYTEPKPKILARHNFVHNYGQIYKEINSVVNVNKVHIEGMSHSSVLFHAKVKSI